MQITLKQLDNELREIALKHVQIQKYFFGEELDIQEANALEYCTLFANINNGSIDSHFVNANLVLAVVDKVDTDKGNLLDVQSDTMQILNDIYSVLQYSTRWQNWNIISDSGNFEKLYDETDSIMAGWSITINLKIKGNIGVCNTAFNNYNFE